MKRTTFTKFLSITLTAALLILIWVPGLAFAQEAGSAAPPVDESTGSAVGDAFVMILKVVFSVLGILATYLTTKAIGYFEKKTKIDVPAAAEGMIFNWADQAIGFASEKAHQVAKQTGQKLSSNEKLNIAVGFVTDLAKKHKLDKLAEDKLTNYIEAKLGLKRMEAAGEPAPTPPPAA